MFMVALGTLLFSSFNAQQDQCVKSECIAGVVGIVHFMMPNDHRQRPHQFVSGLVLATRENIHELLGAIDKVPLANMFAWIGVWYH